MSPEEREIEEAAAEVSARYRAAASDQPSAQLDAAILQAAREEAGRGHGRRNWRVPAAVAAVLVVGVSLSLMTKEVIDPLPPLERKQSADMAKPAAPNLAQEAGPAMKPEPAPVAKGKRDFDSRPSRDRSERADRESEARQAKEVAAGASPPPPALSDEVAAKQAATNQAMEAAPSPAPASVTARPASPEDSQELAQDKLAEKKAAPAAEARRLKSLAKEEASGFAAPPALPADEWIRKIEALVAQGRPSEARLELADFRKRYPDYRLPEGLRSLEPTAGRN